MGNYARGRRFEYHVVDKLAQHGIKSRRVILSGRQPAFGHQPISDIPNADIIIEEKFFGKAKTTKAKKYVSFPEKEILELSGSNLDFLVFNYTRTDPFVVIKFNDFVRLVKIWLEKKDENVGQVSQPSSQPPQTS
jgi:Holliday junction resolvase